MRRFKDTSFLFSCVLVLGIVLRIDYFVSTPQWSRYHDIGDHMGYVNYVQQHWNIPSQSSGAGSEFHQPPLFYYIGAVLHAAGERAGLSHDDFIVVRVFELICSLIVVLLLGWIASLLFAHWFQRLLFLASTVTFPGLIFPNADVNNDILLQLFAVLSFGFLVRWWRSGTSKDAVLFALAVTAALLTKLTALLFLVIIAVALFLHPKLSRKDRIRQAVIFGIPVITLCAYLIWRSLIEHGSGANIIFFESMVGPLLKVSVYGVFLVGFLVLSSMFAKRMKRKSLVMPLAISGTLLGYLSWQLDGKIFGFILLLFVLFALFFAQCESTIRKRVLPYVLGIVVLLTVYVGCQTLRLEMYQSTATSSQQNSVEWGPDIAPYRYVAFNPVRVLDHYLHPQWIGPMTDRFWEYVFKSAYTGEWEYGPRLFPLVQLMWLLGMLQILLGILGLWEERRHPSHSRFPLLMVCALWLMSILAYHLYVPTYWNQDFRLVSLLVLPCMYLVVRGSDRWKGFFGIVSSTVILLHAASCTAFFMALLWGW